MLKSLKKNNYLRLYLLIIGIINVLLLLLPLTNVFGYEFSVLNALLLSFLSGLFTISFLKSYIKVNQKLNREKYISVLRWMLFLPFAISVLNSIIFGFCSFTDGILFYLVITFPSIIIGGALGAYIFILLKRFRVIAFIFLYLFILFIPFLEIYFNPQVYLYNPLFAYFPGTIYDEGLSIDLKLTLYRIFNLLFFIPLLLYSFKVISKGIVINKKSTVFISIIICSIFYFFITTSFGYITTESSLDSKLSTQIESEHFIIHCDKRIEKEKLNFILLNHEYYYTQLAKFFKEEPNSKIKSFIFFDSQQKKNLFGSGVADVAKPWLNSIYISADSWQSTLNHEIAHCFTAGFGTGIFKLASGLNPALIEGVAEAADGFYDENSIHYLASIAYKNNYKINLNSIFNSFSFFGSVSSLVYIYSGSLIKYLVKDYGIQKVKKYYANGDFYETFSANFDSVITNYELFLDTLTLPSTKNQANYYFGRKPLVSKVCPRYISSSLGNAWNYYTSKQTDDAENIFEEILSKTENYNALIGLAKIYEDKDSLLKAIELLDGNIDSFNGTSYEFDLKFRLADLCIKNNEYDKAKELYSSLINSKPNRRLELVSRLRLTLLKRDLIKTYVSGSDFDKYEILKEINLKSYEYSSIPLMIDLSESLNENFELFLSNFQNNFEVKDEISSYALLKLSQFMMQNYDFILARKMSGIASRYKGDPNLLILEEENAKKIEWLLKNSEQNINESKFSFN